MSLRPGVLLVPASSLLLLLAAACGDDDSSAPTSDASPARDAGTSADGAGDAGAAEASWMLTSNLSVNGTSIQDGIRSAIARHLTIDGRRVTQVVLTSAAGHCARVRAGGCVPEGDVEVSIEIEGGAPGTYSVGSAATPQPGTFSLIYSTIERDCAGAGFGPTEGSLTVTAADDRSISLDFTTTISFVGASADLGGTVTAPFCESP